MLWLSKYIFFMLLVLTFMAGFIIQMTVQHEYIHQLIFDKYGIDSNVTYNFWESFKQQTSDFFSLKFNYNYNELEALAWTTPMANSSGNCTEGCKILHVQQEIVDSQTTNIIFAIFIVLILYVLYKEFFSTKIEDVIRYEREELDKIAITSLDEESRFNIRT